MAQSIRIVIAEDHPLVRSSLACLLNSQAGFEVVGEAEDGIEAVEMARRLQPDVMVMDYDMPRLKGHDATRQVTTEFPEIRILGFSWHDDEKITGAMQAAGAVGFLSKGGDTAALTTAIRTAVASDEGQDEAIS